MGAEKHTYLTLKKYYLPIWFLEKISTTYYVLSENTDTYTMSRCFITLFIELIEKYQISTSNLLDLWDFLITNKFNVKQAVLQF